MAASARPRWVAKAAPQAQPPGPASRRREPRVLVEARPGRLLVGQPLRAREVLALVAAPCVDGATHPQRHQASRRPPLGPSEPSAVRPLPRLPRLRLVAPGCLLLAHGHRHLLRHRWAAWRHPAEYQRQRPSDQAAGLTALALSHRRTGLALA